MTGQDPTPAADSEPGERPSAPAATRQVHLSGASTVLVMAGGAVGTGLRYGLTLIMPPVHGIPVAIFIVNVVGAFGLGMLLETLSRFGPDHGPSRRIRLGVGTGVLGGFTTYSTLATDNLALVLVAPAAALAYGTGTVLIGGLASMAGIALARRLVRPVIKRGQVT